MTVSEDVTDKLLQLKDTILFLAAQFANYHYAFRGTTGLLMQGYDMGLDDIDILTNKETALMANVLLKDYLTEKVTYKESAKFKSYFGKFEVNSSLVEVYGDWQILDQKGNWSQAFDADDRIPMAFEGLPAGAVFVMPIETELRMYALMGRWSALHKLKRQLPSKVQKENTQTVLF